ncbi:cytochrome P450 [Calycina marina]|uniref:Cytochrome P450 n=1 Tax=Calycina marina TaxID=1763456 RepID=A0A9P7Z078_9HELO|nr:cytochrome P450 [Calycina marina]
MLGVPATFTLLLLSYLIFRTLVLYTYRILYHPLARFPGPKISAATRWREAYYDLFYGMGGQYTREISRMHEEYGPVLRIGPNEISVNDPWFHEQVYATHPEVRNKIPMIANILGTTEGTFGSIDHHMHRKRKAACSVFFSDSNIVKAEPMLRRHVENFSNRLKEGGSAAVWKLRVNFIALKLDIFSNFAFGSPLGLQEDPKEANGWDDTMEVFGVVGPWLKMFPWILPIAVNFNPTLVNTVWPAIGRILFLRQAEKAIQNLPRFEDQKNNEPTGLFQVLLESNLSDHDKDVPRIAQEGSEMLSASGTTARVMSSCMFWLLERPETLRRLQKELDEAIPDPGQIPLTKELEKYPYMDAVIKESLRMAAPVATRLPLVAPRAIQYKEWSIPAGTAISVNGRDVLHNPDIFDDPHTFLPERWLAVKKIPDQFFVPFGKGTRMCLGRYLAMKELQTTVATLFRRFEFELVDTMRENDVEVVRDCFLTDVKPGSSGVKVRVAGLRD